MSTTWTSFLNGILRMPGAKINRELFLRKTFSELPVEKIRICVSESPVKVVPIAEIEKAASSVINSHTAKVTTLSAIAGIPGGIAMAIAIPADLANYYYHVVSVGQKLGYLYGFPDMIDNDDRLTQDGEIMLTAFIGVMNKVKMANELVKRLAIEIAKRMPEEVAIRVAGNLLSKQIIAQSIEAIAAKLGKQVAPKVVGGGVAKAIPILSGVICGGITYSTFRSQSKRLHEALKENNVSNDTMSLVPELVP